MRRKVLHPHAHTHTLRGAQGKKGFMHVRAYVLHLENGLTAGLLVRLDYQTQEQHVQKHRDRKVQTYLVMGEEIRYAPAVPLFGKGAFPHDANRGIYCLHFVFCSQG